CHVAAHVLGQGAPGVGLLAADERPGQPLRAGRVVPAVAALDAQPALRAGLVAAVHVGDRLAFAVDVVGQRAADPAVGADAVHRVELLPRLDRDAVDRLVRQGAGRAGGHALPAGHAGGGAHGVVEVEPDVRAVALPGPADHVVALDVVAGPDAAIAQ